MGLPKQLTDVIKKVNTPTGKKTFLLFSTMLGLLLIVIGEVTLYYERRVLSFGANPYANSQSLAIDAGLLPTKVTISSAKIDLAVEPGAIVDGVWQISYKNATYLTGSSLPTKNGNIVIYGHNKKVIFGRLPLVKKNDEVTITVKDGRSFKYKVSDISTVTPDKIEAVSPTNYPVLTIYTCTGFLDSKRLVVKAIPIL